MAQKAGKMGQKDMGGMGRQVVVYREPSQSCWRRLATGGGLVILFPPYHMPSSIWCIPIIKEIVQNDGISRTSYTRSNRDIHDGHSKASRFWSVFSAYTSTRYHMWEGYMR